MARSDFDTIDLGKGRMATRTWPMRDDYTAAETHALPSGPVVIDSKAQRNGRRFLENPKTAYTPHRGQIFWFASISSGTGVAEPGIDTGPERSLNAKTNVNSTLGCFTSLLELKEDTA
ncbi:hypothetical protein EDD85DRAFT_962270 [Armillaria nabsnona]|nr:hypothetical protein EDD85DRAFT_962270 [Armillaria nabsnona]